jgi:hypothetical protein
MVLAAFSMKSMQLLRLVGIASNIGFICYAILGELVPIVILHSRRLPMNVWRLAQLRRRSEVVRQS